MNTEAKEEIINDEIQLELPCKLPPEKQFEIARRKCDAEDELEQEQARFDELKSAHSERVKEIERRIDVMRVQIKTGEQRQLVECYERWVANTIERVRKDTREVFDRRAATMLDNQRRLPGTGKPKLTSVPSATKDASALPEDPEKSEFFNPALKPTDVVLDENGDIAVPEGDGKKKPRKKSKPS
jgi:hypothetical protein